MTDTPPAESGIDLARAALAAARAAAKTRPVQPVKTSRTRRVARTGGRDPLALGSAITGMMTERGWEPPEEGGSVLDQWPAIAPELVGKVAAVRLEHDTGVLHLKPVSDAYATQLRLFQPQILRRIREKTGNRAVRALRILAPGDTSAARDETGPRAPGQPSAPAPVRTRETASDGYRTALELTLAHRPSREPADPYTVEAIQRQDQALRAKRLPESEHAEYLAERERLERLAGPTHGSSEASRAAALAYKHREAAGLTQPRRAFDVA
ncbi:DciA family protein [Streptomyces sp. FxanaA7]|uniref:DciA family protein n=1 Tax=Streptomyces sp. FxanaA7 TaxID=1265492 RepID=UPI00069891BF|nr:DciA family protein [Streptomyces sp. FxanaA7]